MTHTTPRRGLTLVELLAVIAIIGLLVALLMPAIQSARESSRRVACGRKLRQVALAMQIHHQSLQTLPPGDAGAVFGTWFPLVMPYIDQIAVGNLYTNWGANHYASTNNAAFTRMRLDEFTCPSDQPQTIYFLGSDWAKHNYCVNYGNTGIDNVHVTAGPSGNGRRPTASLNGATFGGAPFGPVDVNKGPQGGVVFANIRDGLSNTLMLSETVQGKETSAKIDVRGFVAWGDASLFVANSTPNSSDPDLYWNSSACNVPFADNPPCGGFSSSNPGRQFARSRHSGGVQVAMCDGSVRFVEDGIFVNTWRALSTSKGRDVDSAP